MPLLRTSFFILLYDFFIYLEGCTNFPFTMPLLRTIFCISMYDFFIYLDGCTIFPFPMPLLRTIFYFIVQFLYLFRSLYNFSIHYAPFADNFCISLYDFFIYLEGCTIFPFTMPLLRKIFVIQCMISLLI
jgi:hypothetical protein